MPNRQAVSVYLTGKTFWSAVAFEPTRRYAPQFVPSLCRIDRYQSRSDGGLEAFADGSGVGNNGDMYSNFTQIVLKYIMNGAPDEVNLRYENNVISCI